jgi:hypothetical protein
MPGMTHAAAEHWAFTIVRDFRPELLKEPGAFPVLSFYEHHLVRRYHLNTGVAELPVGIEGYTKPDGEIRVAEYVYDGLDADDGRARLTTIHEGIHGVVHLPYLQRMKFTIVSGTAAVGLYRREQLAAYEDPEWQANRIAGAVLMPWPAIKRLRTATGSLSDLQLMRTFKVTGAAASQRLHQVTVLDQLERRGWRVGAA